MTVGVIREAVAADWSGIVLVWQAAFAEKVKIATVMTKIGVEDHLTLVADRAGVIDGFVIVAKTPVGPWRVDYVATHPLDAPKGTGQALMREAEVQSLARGATHLRLAVRRANHRAIRFYEKLGYLRIDDRPGGFSYLKALAA